MTTREKFTAARAEYIRRLNFRGVSPKTVRNYDLALRRFSDYLTALPADPAEPDLYSTVETFRDSLLSAGASPATVRQYLTELKVFFEKATKRSFPEALRFAENPVDPDFLPIVKKKPYDTLLPDEALLKLWENRAPTAQTAHWWPRNYALVVLILATGLRNKEVLDLSLSDVDFLHSEITVRSGKGDKYRVVDAPEIVLTAIELYLQSGLRPDYLPDDAPLFGTTAAHTYGKGALTSASKTVSRPSAAGAEREGAAAERKRVSAPAGTRPAELAATWHRGTQQWLSDLVNRHVATVCGEDKTSDIRTHDLRHLFARLQLNASGNMSELQAALGHAQVTTTQIYAGRIMPHRARDSAREVLKARDAAGERNAAMVRSSRCEISEMQTTVPEAV